MRAPGACCVAPEPSAAPEGDRGAARFPGPVVESGRVTTISSDADFEQLSWHDCTIWGLELYPPDPDAGDWTCDLALDIDFIVEWLCGVGAPGRAQFRVAPATLRFHTVSDLRLAITWGSTAVLLHEMSIDHVAREPLPPASRESSGHRWRIALNWPQSGEITFTAVGFTQTLRALPIVTERQSLTRRQRASLLPLPPA